MFPYKTKEDLEQSATMLKPMNSSTSYLIILLRNKLYLNIYPKDKSLIKKQIAFLKKVE